jgi:hypothetical protein
LSSVIGVKNYLVVTIETSPQLRAKKTRGNLNYQMLQSDLMLRSESDSSSIGVSSASFSLASDDVVEIEPEDLIRLGIGKTMFVSDDVIPGARRTNQKSRVRHTACKDRSLLPKP